MNKGKICVSVCAATRDELIAKIAAAEAVADVVEVRFDCLPEFDFDWLPAISKEYLFTLRPEKQGGCREVSVAERERFVTAAGDRFVDIEWDHPMVSVRGEGNVVSLHDFQGQADTVERARDLIERFPGSTVKVAVQTDDITDSLELWKLLDGHASFIPIAMGEAGKWTRILGLDHGAPMTYASLEAGDETAPGQISARDLIEVYRVKELDRETKVLGVIGNPLGNSKSVYMHNPGFIAAGVNAVFIPLEVTDLDAFMRRMVLAATREVELNFVGFSVTMPHKQSILKYLDDIDPVAARIGAVNTIKIDGGTLTGYNTDAPGFIQPLIERYGSVAGSRVAVCGAGGAARSVIFALHEEGAEVMVYARDGAKAGVIAEEFGIRSGSISDLRSEISNKAGDGLNILVDATPLGMKGPFENDSLFTAEELAGVKFVYDLVTSAVDTPIVTEAKKAGVPAIGGLEMLIAQGARQFEIWTGCEAPIDVMRRSVTARVK